MNKDPDRSGPAPHIDVPDLFPHFLQNVATLDRVYLSHRTKLVNYATRKLKGYQAGADVAGEAYYRAVTTLPKLREPMTDEHARRLLSVIAHRLILDEHHRSNRFVLGDRSEARVLAMIDSRRDNERVEMEVFMEETCRKLALTEVETRIAWRLLDDDNRAAIARDLGVEPCDVYRTIARLAPLVSALTGYVPKTATPSQRKPEHLENPNHV